jgi:crotonobetainyl-CoA:carnitine CoA-transferase CaiB-like acyl-CoA transferase
MKRVMEHSVKSTKDDRETLPRPLEGIRIIECGIWHAGPGASAIFADLGAEVIKLESLDGDPERLYGSLLGRIDFTAGKRSFPGGDKEDWNLLFEMSNRNKKGICVNLTTPEGKKIVNRLVETADIFLTNLRQPATRKLQIDYESLKQVNPRIIHLSVSGFGSRGTMADVGGFDQIGQAMSGMLFLTGADKPVVLQTIILDQLTAITASHAMLTALFVRERHGYGQALHVSLYGSAIWLMYANITATSVMNKNIQVNFDRTVNPPLRNFYKCSDGKWLMGVMHPERQYWPAFCEATGLKHLDCDPRFATSEARVENVTGLIAAIDEALLAKTRDEWLKIFHENNLNFGPIQDFQEVLEDPQALINDYIITIDHPTLGLVKVPGYPVQFSANQTCTGPAPDRGQHTDVVLAKVGYSPDDIAGLRHAGVVK